MFSPILEKVGTVGFRSEKKPWNESVGIWLQISKHFNPQGNSEMEYLATIWVLFIGVFLIFVYFFYEKHTVFTIIGDFFIKFSFIKRTKNILLSYAFLAIFLGLVGPAVYVLPDILDMPPVQRGQEHRIPRGVPKKKTAAPIRIAERRLGNRDGGIPDASDADSSNLHNEF